MSDVNSKKPLCDLTENEKAYLERESGFGMSFYCFNYNPDTQCVSILDQAGYLVDYIGNTLS